MPVCDQLFAPILFGTLTFSLLNTVPPSLSALAESAVAVVPIAEADGIIRPFNSTSLDGWNGEKSYWSVEDGALVGRSTIEHPLSASTYLVWDGDMPANFDLRCKVRIVGGNSGIHYRSGRVDGRTDIAGFQADLDANNSYTGILYEGLGREIMSARGERVEWGPSGKRLIANFAPDAVLKNVMKVGEWNDYRVEANGTRIRHWINGTLMTDVTDGDASRFRRDGQLGFQLHAGAPMEVKWKDIEVRAIVDAPPVSSLSVPEGFTAELVVSAKAGQGSWVSLAFDPAGRAFVSPQSGAVLRLDIPGVSRGFTEQEVRVTELPEVPPSAQGLCFTQGDFWVDSSAAGPQSGVWRLRDHDGDGVFEDRTRVIEWPGDGGEHGPHGLVAGPDGAIYVAVGNHTPVPANVGAGATTQVAEDLPGERMWDPRGHAVGIVAPGGTVIRIDTQSLASTLFASGFRNHYDLAFNPDGELFTYDSDMEWDIGAPWYRAPRIVHVVSGGDYGWRSGSGCWPAWFPDSLPPACETDSASPTGMLHGSGGKFGKPWSEMLFAADWTFGRILAVQLTPAGSTYTAQWQPFITGRPMPVTDMAWGPDGAMYIVTGGRGTQSGIYRIRANDPVQQGATAARVATGGAVAAAAPAPDRAFERARADRRALESLTRPLSSDATDLLLAGLASDDRFTAFAARLAVERAGGSDWWEKYVLNPAAHQETTDATLQERRRSLALLALARSTEAASWKQAITNLANDPPAATRDAADTDSVQRRAWTQLICARAAQIVGHRHWSEISAEPSSPLAAALLKCVMREINNPDPRIAEMALTLATAMDQPEAVSQAMQRLQRSSNRSDALRWATILRMAKTGWTKDARLAYWQWLDAADDSAGGFSLRGFIDHIKADAQAHVGRPAAPAAPLSGGGASGGAASGASTQQQASAPSPAVAFTPGSTRATLHSWTVDELATAMPDDQPPDLAHGGQLFHEAMCIQCHRIGGTGGANGPDLTGVAGRFSRTDLLRAILEPSAAVSDQWKDSAILTADGSMVIGRIVSTENFGTPEETLVISTNPLSSERERVLRSTIKNIETVSTSSMPKGLLDSRSRQEILDLLAALEAGKGEAGKGNLPSTQKPATSVSP